MADPTPFDPCVEWIERCLDKIETHFRTVNPDALKRGVLKEHVRYKFENDLLAIHDNYNLSSPSGTLALRQKKKSQNQGQNRWILDVQFDDPEALHQAQLLLDLLDPFHSQDLSAFEVSCKAASSREGGFFIAPIGGRFHAKVEQNHWPGAEMNAAEYKREVVMMDAGTAALAPRRCEWEVEMGEFEGYEGLEGMKQGQGQVYFAGCCC